MDNKKKIERVVLISLLVVSLAGFNSPLFLVSAEEGGNASSTSSTATSTETVSDSTSTEEVTDSGDGEEEGSEGEQVVSGNSAGDDTQEPIVEGSQQSTSTEETEEIPEDTTTSTDDFSTTTEDLSTSTEELGDSSASSTQDSMTATSSATSTEETQGQEEEQLVEEVVDNEAEVENEVENEAISGENEVTGEGDGDAVVFTGDANLVVGVMNTANSNITESDFSQFLFNAFGAVEGDIDLGSQLNLFSGGFCMSEGGCSHLVSGNQGDIENDVLIKALTGANAASTDSGVAYINTGNVNVVADVFNILNSNVVGSNWTKFIINIFNDWEGDLIMPSSYTMEEFAEQSSATCGGACNGSSTVQGNEAQINNDVSVTVDTGQNTVIARDGSGIIDTGIANAQSNISNIANSNVEGGNWFFMAVNNFGTWQGSVFSLPKGYEIKKDAKGIKIYNVGPEELAEGEGEPSSSVVVDNSGSINNSVIINVSTGGNTAKTERGTGYIKTGHANVLTDIMNILNSNIIGSNWLSGMVNVFGRWQGDLAFGRPDLWLGESAETEKNPTGPGEIITYTLTYKNNGDAPATGVTLLDDFDEKFVSVRDEGGGKLIDNPGEIEWDLGTLEAGETGSVSYQVVVDSDIPGGKNKIVNEAILDSYEDDWDDGDNQDSLSVDVYKFVSTFEGMPALWYYPKLKIKKEYLGDNPITPPANADYRITVVNDSFGPALGVMVEDNLLNENLEIVNTYQWDLGYVFPGERIAINYTVGIGRYVPPGVYTNYAQATGVSQKGSEVSSSLVSREIEVLEAPPQEDGVTWDEVKQEMEEIEQKIEIIKQETERTKPKNPPRPEPKEVMEGLIEEVSNTGRAQAEEGGKDLVLEKETTTEPILKEEGEESWVWSLMANVSSVIWNLLVDKINVLFSFFNQKVTSLAPQLTSLLLVFYGFWRSIQA